jgi:hypothetical protein
MVPAHEVFKIVILTVIMVCVLALAIHGHAFNF